MLPGLDEHVALSVLSYVDEPKNLAAIAITCKRLCNLVKSYQSLVVDTMCKTNRLLSVRPNTNTHVASNYERLYNSHIALIGGDGHERQCDVFDTKDHSFVRRCGAGIKRTEGSALVFHGGLICAISGIHMLSQCCVEAYDIVRNDWIGVPALPDMVFNIAACSAVDRLFVIGGMCGRNQPSNRIYELRDELLLCAEETETATSWRTIEPDGFIGRYNHSCAFYHGRIWIAGGYATERGRYIVTQATELYDPVTETMQLGPPFCVLRSRCFLLVVDGQLYAVGGDVNVVHMRAQPATIECFDEARQQWQVVGELPFPWIVTTAAGFRNRIYVFGSRSLGSPDCMFDYFDVRTRRWGSVDAGCGTEDSGCFPISSFMRKSMRNALAVTVDLQGHPALHHT